MPRKISLYSFTLLALLLSGTSVFAQEEGSSNDKEQGEVIIPQDSSIIYESGDYEQIVHPTPTPFNIPVKESQRKNTTPLLENSVSKPLAEGEMKPKDAKQDFSFNIIYYLIYKFKQVDN